VQARVVVGVNVFLEWLAGWSDAVGGRSIVYQSELDRMQRQLLQEIEIAAIQRGGNGVVGLRIDYDQFTGSGKSMLMASAVGTAVRLAPQERRRPVLSELGIQTEAEDVGRVLDEVRRLIGWSDAFVAGHVPSAGGKAMDTLTAPDAWAAAVEREGTDLVDRFILHLQSLPQPRAKLLMAHLLTRRPEIERVDAAAAFLEDTANLPEFEGIAHVVAGHWPLIAPRLNTWLERGGPYRALAMKVIAFGTNTSIRLADADAFEGLITTTRAVRWGNATPVAARWICGCASVPNAPSDERCGNCGLLTRGLHTRDVPFHPSLLLLQLVQQHKLLRFIQPVPTSGEPLDPHRERGHPT